MCQDGKSRGIDLSVNLTYKRKVDTRNELNVGRFIGVFLATDNLKTVNSVLMNSLTKREGKEIVQRLHISLDNILDIRDQDR